MGLLGGDNTPKSVVMTEVHAQAIVNAVVEAVAERAKDGVLENYRQMARLEADLAKERELTARQATEIANLNSHITQLNGFVSSLVPGAARLPIHGSAPVQPPYPPLHTPMPVLTPAPTTNHNEPA